MITIRQHDTYLARIHGLPGTTMFRHLFADVDGSVRDLAKDGALSCAIVVSSVLTLSKLIDGPRATVDSTVRALEASGWTKTSIAAPGAVLVWEPIEEHGTSHAHIGFSLGGDRAISNETSSGVPAEHHWTYGVRGDGKPVRAITAIYTHPILDAR